MKREIPHGFCFPRSLRWVGAMPMKRSDARQEFCQKMVGKEVGVNPKIRVGPENGWFISWKILLKWMIWEVSPYFWKHPGGFQGS